ncbi:flagellar hook-associated protein FlgL [Candidatus Nitrospira allomarina]|uniref:Flagellar hook-associated protein FlgL n=1 Tax=Candidatus Nitrospira allomarina TaxID=3020900 RepID=A0AA96G7G8_9BACT|nr:flagellar hook-associated protein FlgL [Candidatus Nitrospira allomarina]WNM56814.1 flagellar hook-associated protein FlgL [Candidatus Nitrospira allomarina]
MRVTDRQQVDALLRGIQGIQRNIGDRQEQISSGKRVNRPSDDPAASERINQFRNVLRTTEHRLNTVNEGIGRLNLSDSVLGQAGNTVQRAKELALDMASDTNTSVERRNAAQEVQQLILGLAGIANTQLNGRFVFAGSQTKTEPFVPDSATGSASITNGGGAGVGVSVASAPALQPDAYQIQFTSSTQFDVLNLTTNQTVSSGNTYASGATFSFDGLDVTITDGGGPPAAGDQFFVRVGYTYQGDGAGVEVEVGDGRTVASNVPGDQIFSGPTVDLFQNLQDFHQALVTNDASGIQAAIGQFDQALSQVNDARATIGARVNRLDTIKDGLDLLSVNTQTLRSDFEDADIAQVASDLATLQNTLEASMSTLARQFQTNLLDFIK